MPPEAIEVMRTIPAAMWGSIMLFYLGVAMFFVGIDKIFKPLPGVIMSLIGALIIMLSIHCWPAHSAEPKEKQHDPTPEKVEQQAAAETEQEMKDDPSQPVEADFSSPKAKKIEKSGVTPEQEERDNGAKRRHEQEKLAHDIAQLEIERIRRGRGIRHPDYTGADSAGCHYR